MPEIRFRNLPRPLWEHILERVAERAIVLDDLQRLRSWVATQPQAPDADWYKDFGSFIICGTGEYPKTILKKAMKPFGTAPSRIASMWEYSCRLRPAEEFPKAERFLANRRLSGAV